LTWRRRRFPSPVYSLQFFNQSGAQVTYQLDPAQAGMTGSIPAGSQAIVRTTGSGSSTNLGWGQLTAPVSVSGMLIYQQQASPAPLQEGSALTRSIIESSEPLPWTACRRQASCLPMPMQETPGVPRSVRPASIAPRSSLPCAAVPSRHPGRLSGAELPRSDLREART